MEEVGFMRVRGDQTINTVYNLRLSFFCPMDLAMYPHDIQKCPLTFTLPPGSENMNIHLYTTDVLQPPHQEDLRVVVEYIPGLNNSMAGVNILTSRPIFSHLLYQYLPAAFLCVLSLLSLMIPLSLSSSRLGVLIVILVLLSTILRSVRAQLPFYSSPTFLEIYIGLLLTLVIMLFLQTFYLILRYRLSSLVRSRDDHSDCRSTCSHGSRGSHQSVVSFSSTSLILPDNHLFRWV